MKLSILFALCLAACACVPEAAQAPLSVPCHTPKIARPAWALDMLPANATLYEQVRATLVEIEQRSAYETELSAAVSACN